eukprot:TRINITY_DN6163_c0_g1_i1.p1 TRINITY_DN6163_c0_g1~~TRINITY_DN6163_c0_g1_i1.p1  ORF type:complete len:162 (-),score=47.31 TRINITY_DN6163_c0_g1_i1:173-658(-)
MVAARHAARSSKLCTVCVALGLVAVLRALQDAQSQQDAVFVPMPLRAAALAGALVATMPSEAAMAEIAQANDFDASNIQLADRPVNLGGKAGGGLQGTYQIKGEAKKSDFDDDERSIKADEKFAEKFDQYIGVFGILFIGAFVAPMVTYFWYVRDSDPWQN